MYAKCPKCGSDRTHSSRVRPGERTATTVFMKPMRCRQCKERFWVQNPSAYMGAAALLGGTALFLGLVWLVVMHATRSQEIYLPTHNRADAPLAVPEARTDDADLQAAAAQAPDTQAPESGNAPPAQQSGAGLSSPEDRTITVQWYRDNAEKGDLDAQYKLGLLHLTGKGALQDFGEAAKWLKLAAEQGHPQAQYQLGLIYRVGHGVQTDQAQAYKWLNLAAAAGVNQAVLVRNEVMRQLSAEQLATAQKASREWQATRPKVAPAGESKPVAAEAEQAATEATKPSAAEAKEAGSEQPPPSSEAKRQPAKKPQSESAQPTLKARAELPDGATGAKN